MKLDIASWCNREIACNCGHTHFCPIADVIVENGALNRLPEMTAQYHNIVLVADENTYAACGHAVEALLADRVESTLIFRREGLLVPDERAIDELDARLTSATDFVIGVGSGVINDICKYVTWKHGMEYAIVATAPSMDGYASSGAAMIIGGMKITYTTRPPQLIVADVDVIKKAPLNMIRSGYGDIIGKYSALNDWRLSHLINNEYFCREIYDLVLEVTNTTRDEVERIIACEDEAIAFLTKALILIGITLSLLGSTRPGSGSEHHLSHFFEITGLIHDQPYFLHGTDVAYSTVVTAGMREKIRALSAPEFCHVSAQQRSAAYERIFADYASEVQKLQDDAHSYEKDRTALYRERWAEICAILAECPSKTEIADMFVAAGYDMDAFERMYGKEKIHDAMLYGKDLKDRYSVLWLYYALFGDQ